MSTEYVVTIEQFAKRHFIKSFEKKYKGAWEITWAAVEEEFKRFDSLFETSIAETIVDGAIGGESVKICKTEFRVAGTKESRHGSGNRCIVAVHTDTRVVHVLLIYHKNDLGHGNETAQWKQMIKDNYSEYRGML